MRRAASRPAGTAPYSTVSAKPGKRWLNHIVIVPWQLLPQFRLRHRQVERLRDPAGERRALR